MEGFPVNALDLGVLIVILASALLSLLLGFFREMLLITSWGGAFFASLYGEPFVRPYMRDLIDHDLGATAATYVGVFVVSLIFLSVILHYLGSALRIGGLTAVNRSLGFVYGLLRGAVLVSLSYLVLVGFSDGRPMPPWITEARTLPIMEQGAKLLWRLIPPDIRDGMGDWSTRIENKAADAVLRQRYDRLVAPTVKPDASETTGGYTDDQRRELDRKFGTPQ